MHRTALLEHGLLLCCPGLRLDNHLDSDIMATVYVLEDAVVIL
jgi:hypothetical protein